MQLFACVGTCLNEFLFFLQQQQLRYFYMSPKESSSFEDSGLFAVLYQCSIKRLIKSTYVCLLEFL